MKDRRPGGLSADDRRALMSAVDRRAGRSEAERPREAGEATAMHAAATDFTTLPGYRDLLRQRSVADLVGIDNPYFRRHDGRAGATTSIAGRTLVNFASYDYLGLNGHPAVAAAAKAAIDTYGVSPSASRIVAGERAVHRTLEAALADLYSAEDCVVMVSGHATNAGIVGHLVGRGDLVVHDGLIHNSVLVGAQASGADRRSLPHNDLDALEALLGAVRHRFGRVLIVVEGLYSMDGDHPDLARLVEIKRRFGAWLMVDEAHALGVMGARGTGSAEHLGVDPSGVDIWMGTLSKTLAGCGGYIAGKAALVDYLKCTLPGFVYSVGLAPPLAAAAAAALAVMAAEPERVARLQANGQRFRARALAQGLDVGTSAGLAIVPVMVRDSLKAVMLGQRLFERGINVLPIVHPAVPERTARLRFFITAEHGADTIDAAVDAVAEEAARVTDTGTTLGAAVRAFT